MNFVESQIGSETLIMWLTIFRWSVILLGAILTIILVTGIVYTLLQNFNIEIFTTTIEESSLILWNVIMAFLIRFQLLEQEGPLETTTLIKSLREGMEDSI